MSDTDFAIFPSVLTVLGILSAGISPLSHASEISLNCRYLMGGGEEERNVDSVVVDLQNNRMQFHATSSGAGWSYDANGISSTQFELRPGGKVVMTSIRAGVPSFSIINLTTGHLVWVHQVPDKPIVYNEYLCVPPPL